MHFLVGMLKAVQDKNKSDYFLSADFQANPTDISWKKVVFLVI